MREPLAQRPILFDSDRTGRAEIYALEPASTRPPRQLTNSLADNASSSFPTWSPDGRNIAFILTLDGNADIAVMEADGSKIRRLTTHAAADLYPTWSPDGSLILFGSDRDQGGRSTPNLYIRH